MSRLNFLLTSFPWPQLELSSGGRKELETRELGGEGWTVCKKGTSGMDSGEGLTDCKKRDLMYG